MAQPSPPPPLVPLVTQEGEGANYDTAYSKKFILVQAAFFRGNSMIQFNYKQMNKGRQVF